MYGKMRKNIGFSLLPFACLFLFEPHFALTDILPDFIGYFILCVAIINLADINSKVRDAFVNFRRALALSVAKYLSIYLLDNFFVGQERTVSLLLFTFVFSFLELVVLIPAYKDLFEGFLYLGLLYGGEAVYYSKKVGKANITERAFRSTFVFLILQKFAATLPEFTTLVSHSFYEFIILLRVFGIIIVLPVGITWLIKMINYCNHIKKDTQFIGVLSDLYQEKATSNPQFFTVRVLSTGILTLAIGFVFSVDFFSDGLSIIPDYICYGLILLSSIFLHKYSKKWKIVFASSLFGAIISVPLQIANDYFAKNFYFSDIAKKIDAYNAYYTVFYLKIAEGIAFAMTFVSALIFLWDIYKTHSDLSRIEKGKEHKELKWKYIRGAVISSITALLAVVSGVFYFYAQPFYYTAWYYYYSMIISISFNLIFAFVMWYFLENITTTVKSRYALYL